MSTNGYPVHDLYPRQHPELFEKATTWLFTPNGQQLAEELQPLSETLRKGVVPEAFQNTFELNFQFASPLLARIGIAAHMIGVALRQNMLVASENSHYITPVDPGRFAVPNLLGKAVVVARGDKMPMINPSDYADMGLAIGAHSPGMPPKLKLVGRHKPLPRII